MAHTEETPVHEVRPTSQEVPARFIPQPTLEPGHSYASITDHISTIVLPNGNIIIDGNKLLQQLGVIQYQQAKEKDQEQ